MELPDWLRGIILLGHDGEEYRVVSLDEDGQLGVVLKAAAEVTIPGDVSVDQNDSIREMQGVEGVTLRTVAVDADGQIIMVPRGSTGNYMAVDANGYLGAILKAAAEVTIPGDVNVTQEASTREMQGAEGVTLRTVAVDANGQIIMVPRGASGVYMSVSPAGALLAEMQGYEAGVGPHLVAVDNIGQIIMVPKGVSGHYMSVDADGYLTARMRGYEAGVGQHDIAVDNIGQVIMVPKGVSGHYMSVDSDGFLTALMRGYEAGVGQHDIAVDNIGQVIMVPKGVSGYYMAIDSDGFMSAVMKGSYGATLKTLAADDEGYLIATLTDGPDQWGKKISVGLAELAVRLGSPISWDRRGQVVQMQTFVDGLGYCIGSSSGAGSSDGLDTGVFQTGKQSYKLVTGTDGSKSASITMYTDYSPSARVGFEITFSIADQPDNVYLVAAVYDGTYNYAVRMRWLKTTNKLQVFNSAEGYTDVCDFQLPAAPQLFVSVKVVIDLDENEWVRLLSRGVEYDISAVVPYRALSDTHPYVTFRVQAVEDGDTSHTIYVDRMIVTTNEP